MKAYTDLEQSKKLSEFLPLETADMYWEYDFTEHECVIKVMDKHFDDTCIPAWSLSALLELIPPYLGEFSEGIDFEFSKSMNGKWYSARYIQLSDDKAITFNKVVTGDTAVDAAFEMVVWLKENNKI